MIRLAAPWCKFLSHVAALEVKYRKQWSFSHFSWNRQCIKIIKHTQDASRLSRAEAAMQCLAWGDACCRSEWNSMLHSEAKRCHTSIESEGTYYKTCQIISNHMMIVQGIESLYIWVSMTLHRFERAMALGWKHLAQNTKAKLNWSLLGSCTHCTIHRKSRRHKHCL